MSIQNPPPAPPAGPPSYYSAPPPQGPWDPKGHAKAAKAYAKAQRPWFKKKRFIGSGLLVLLIVIIVAATASGGSKSPSAAKPGTTPAPTAAATKAAGNAAASKAAASKAAASKAAASKAAASKAQAAAGGSALPIQSGDWRLDSIRVQDDGLGDFGGVARVTYTGNDASGGTNVFTLTVFKSGKDIAALNGSADGDAPGDSVTVQFVVADKFVAGAYTYDFQKDM
jgi:hypothetical protein